MGKKNALKIEIYLRKNCPYILHFSLLLCVFCRSQTKNAIAFFSDGIYFSAWWYLSKILLKFMGASIDFSTFFSLCYLFDLIRHKKGIHSYILKNFSQQQRRRKIFFSEDFFFVKRKHFCAQFGRFFIGLLRWWWWLLKFFCELETMVDWEIF